MMHTSRPGAARPFRHGLLVCLAIATSAAGALIAQAPSTPPPAAGAAGDWPTYNRDPGGTRFSPLTDLTPANVATLAVAWTYHMKPATAAPATPAPSTPAGHEEQPAAAAPALPSPSTSTNQTRGRRGYASSSSTPLVVGGTLYMSTPYARVVALDPTTGREKWAYQLPSGNPSTRGLEYWPGDATTPAQIVFGTSDAKLYSIAAATGVPNPAFGTGGVISLDTPEILRGLPGRNGLTSPPIVYEHLAITGGTTQENPPRGPAGDVRAWDMHTGKLVWTFRSVPQAGERFGETWGGDSAKNRSGVNVWGFLTVDVARGIVYMPFGAPSVDQYGGDRPGDNLFGTSIVAAKADTGEYLWHFQLTHHDIWDADLAAAPVLLDVRRAGKTIPAVAVVSKLGLLFVLDRVTGKPIDAVEERPVPASEVPLERAAKTQPFPVVTPPLSRMSMAAADVATVTPALEADCRKLMEGVQLGGPYLPPAFNRLRVQFPGNHGGVNWGGMSYSPELGYLFVNTNELGQLSGMMLRPEGATGPATAKGQGNRLDPGGPYEGVAGGGRFSVRTAGDPQQLPCQQPPWGQLTAIDMKTGTFAWRVPLGVTDSLPPAVQKTGRPGNGGTIVTRGGLVFVGATDDARFRAFDAKTGKELWTFKLPAAAQATPITYRGADGRQYVVITSTGGGFFGNPVTDDSVMAFALPKPAPSSQAAQR
jgi:quinoprotein glucose dehydrogenase